MLRRKIKNIIKRCMCCLVLLTSVIVCGLSINTYAHKKPSSQYSYTLKEDSIIRYSSKKVLIYNTHEIETYADGYSVVDASHNLKEKLEKLGYDVTIMEGVFSANDYNRAYGNSRRALEQIENLTDYNLIIDLHRDYGTTSNTTNIGGNDCCKLMFVTDRSAKYYDDITHLTNNLSSKLGNYSTNLVKPNFEYNSTSNYHFNQDISKNSVLLELGNNENTKYEVQRSITWLTSAIDQYLREQI